MVKSLILCEGGDDIGFINLFLKFLEINSKNITIKKLDNKSNFFKLETYKDKNILESLENGEYDKVLFVFDSDYIQDDRVTGGFVNSEKSIQKITKEIKSYLGFDLDLDYYIMCDPISKDGNLEHLIISTLNEKKQICVNQLLECIETHKTYGNKKIVLSSYKTIFDEPNYNFLHQNFKILKDKLEALSLVIAVIPS